MLLWVYWLVFAVAALMVDRFANLSAQTRIFFRVVVLVLAFLWILALTGVLARVGIV